MDDESASRGAPPFDISVELRGWTLFWAHLTPTGDESEALATLRGDVAKDIQARLTTESLANDPTVRALRELFKAAGTSPSRYRPSSEALLRRLIKGASIPQIHPLVDLNNCLSARLAVPCCVMDESKLQPPFVFRAGGQGEAYESLRGPFRLEGRPLLLDGEGPADAPITGGVRVKVHAETRDVWLVAYLPTATLDGEHACRELDELLAQAPVARRGDWFAVGSAGKGGRKAER